MNTVENFSQRIEQSHLLNTGLGVIGVSYLSLSIHTPQKIGSLLPVERNGSHSKESSDNCWWECGDNRGTRAS